MSSVALTTQNKLTLKNLLKTGRWGNESEILRYGLHLVENEVRQRNLPQPLPEGVLAAWYKKQPKVDQDLENKLAKASAKIKPEPIE
jgi:Arc/MetJ-type ribon-helix-helix transcriptional regulator